MKPLDIKQVFEKNIFRIEKINLVSCQWLITQPILLLYPFYLDSYDFTSYNMDGIIKIFGILKFLSACFHDKNNFLRMKHHMIHHQ